MAQITMSDMLKAGLHFGHQTRRWNPKMKQFILTQRNGIHIINLFKSLDMIDKAYDFIKATVAHNGTVLFVGTKKQAQEAVQTQATRVNMPLRVRALARRHADQLPDRVQARLPSQGTRRDGLHRRAWFRSDQEGTAASRAREGQAG